MSNALIIAIYIVAIYGASTVMVFGSGPFRILERIRVFANRIHPHFGLLFSCMMCFPTNLGIVLSLISIFLSPIRFTPFSILFYGHNSMWPLTFIMDAAFSSGAVWFIHNFLEYFVKKADETQVTYATEDTTDDEIIMVEDITKRGR